MTSSPPRRAGIPTGCPHAASIRCVPASQGSAWIARGLGSPPLAFSLSARPAPRRPNRSGMWARTCKCGGIPGHRAWPCIPAWTESHSSRGSGQEEMDAIAGGGSSSLAMAFAPRRPSPENRVGSPKGIEGHHRLLRRVEIHLGAPAPLPRTIGQHLQVRRFRTHPVRPGVNLANCRSAWCSSPAAGVPITPMS